MANVATSAWSIALTVAVVDRIVRRESEAGARQRRGYALEQLGTLIRSLAFSVARDHIYSHPRTPEDLPTDLIATIDHCLASWATREAESPWPPVYPGLPLEPRLIRDFRLHAEPLRELRGRNSDVLLHDLVIALDQFNDAVAAALFGSTHGLYDHFEEQYQRRLVEDFRWLAASYAAHCLTPMQFDALDVHLLARQRERLRRRRFTGQPPIRFRIVARERRELGLVARSSSRARAS